MLCTLDSIKTSVALISNNLTPYNELGDKGENTVVKNKLNPVRKITLDSFAKPKDQ
jgi:hypothetical protein